MTAPSEIYLAAIDRVVARAQSWSPDDAATAIPACPGWSAHDLVAHLAGGAADHAAGRLDGFPGPAWTGRHIAERTIRPTSTVLAELTALAAETAARCDTRPMGPNSSWDAYIHERDLAAAFEVEPSALDDHGREILRQIGGFLGARGLVEITVTPAEVHVAVEHYEATAPAHTAFDTLTGRGRPGAQWQWRPTAPTADVLRRLSLF